MTHQRYVLAVLALILSGPAQAVTCLGKDTGDFGSSDICGMHPYYEHFSNGGNTPAGGGGPAPDPDPDPEPEPDPEPDPIEDEPT